MIAFLFLPLCYSVALMKVFGGKYRKLNFKCCYLCLVEHVFSKPLSDYRVETNTVSCIITKKTFLISFADNQQNLINEDFSPMHWEENVDFGGYYVYCTKKGHPGEGYFGLGDKPTTFNMRGRRFQNWNTDTKVFGKVSLRSNSASENSIA